MTDKHRDYILKHWNEYDLTDTYDEFIALINILEAHGENIDTLHAATINNYKVFCGMVGECVSDRDTVKWLFYFNNFLATPDDVAAVIYDDIEYYNDCGYTPEEVDTEIKETYCDDLNGDKYITRTHDGYVLTVSV